MSQSRFECPPGCQEIIQNILPTVNPNAKFLTPRPLVVQIIDVLDVGSSRQAQLDKLEGNTGRRMHTEEEKQGDNFEGLPSSKKCWKLVVEDSRGNQAVLMFHHQPSEDPLLGSVIELPAGIEVHRGILLVQSPDKIKIRVPGQNITREQWQWRLAAEQAR